MSKEPVVYSYDDALDEMIDSILDDRSAPIDNFIIVGKELRKCGYDVGRGFDERYFEEYARQKNFTAEELIEMYPYFEEIVDFAKEVKGERNHSNL